MLPYGYRTDELIGETSKRLLEINSRKVASGGRIENLQAMTRKVVRTVCHDEDRKRQHRSLDDMPEGRVPFEPISEVDSKIKNLEYELMYSCYLECLALYPKMTQTFLRYHPDVRISREREGEIRAQLAEELVAGDGEILSKLNTLRVRVQRWKARLTRCMQRRFAKAVERNIELTRLYDEKEHRPVN